MEGITSELLSVSQCLQNFPKFPLWIIEYIWAHRMMDIQEVVDPSTWPEVDSQPLSLEDSWRLRVASAQAYSIVKNRDVGRFERVMGFLEANYRLLPRLVAPIKHMKIIFGLKTMVIMWMLREGRGMVDTMFKINQFFQSKLPQYRDKCSQHKLFLMRKNHLDFKTLAQSLAMDKEKCDDYIKTQMEKQYGEQYAQKVEERLLHYLHELEAVLPGDTYIDKILKKESPVTEEEKLLLEVITSDSTTIATTLKKLLHCDVASCHQGRVSQSSEHGKNRMESSQQAKTPLEFQVFREGDEAHQSVSKHSPHWLESENDPDVRRHKQTEEDGDLVKRMEEENSVKHKEKRSRGRSECVQESTSSPQFCSKHQRWVKSILQECPDECPEELLLHTNVSSSPLLFQSSSSTSTSQDLTPSNLIPPPPYQHHPPSEDKRSSGSAKDTSQTEPLPQSFSSRDTLLPALLSPVVQLIDIAHVRGIYPVFKPHQVSPNHFTMSSNKQAASTSSPRVRTSPHRYTLGYHTIPKGTVKDSTFDRLETVTPTNHLNTTHKDASTSVSCLPPTRQSFSRLSRSFRRARTTNRHSQALDGFTQNPVAGQFEKAPTTFQISCPPLPNDFNVSDPLTKDASTSTSQIVSQNSIKTHSRTLNISPFQSKALPCSTVISSTSNSDCLAVRSETSRAQRVQLRLSLPSQVVLLQSKLLQPFVHLNRLSAQECYRVTKGRSSTRNVECVVQGSNDDFDEDKRKEEEEVADCSFDLNSLYSSHSSSDSEDSLDCDPDYKPRIIKKRLLYERV